HRRMASSIAALASSLQGVAARLQSIASGRPTASSELDSRDLEDDTVSDARPSEDGSTSLSSPSEVISDELRLVESFVARARALPHDSKAESLVKAVELILERPADRQKVVVFTESLTTQDYLRDLLMQRLPISTE